MQQGLPNQIQMQSLTSAWCAAKPRRCTMRFTLGKPLSLPFMLPTFRPYCKHSVTFRLRHAAEAPGSVADCWVNFKTWH